eukprot:TRINITY_DN1416_c0_g1_i3.p1 TRINITY_DN1416_c0_g1~~TRINITY_DN1416_c0_g1_i3.p1  ORF type:complete len:228 (-),score=45.19 TRINITY_DN1416_c0_g1_i3:131-814(-)
MQHDRDGDYVDARDATGEPDDADYDDDANQSLRARMNAYIANVGSTKAAMARKLSVDRSVLSRWLNGGRSTNSTLARLVGSFLRMVERDGPIVVAMADEEQVSNEPVAHSSSTSASSHNTMPPVEVLRKRLRAFMQREQWSQDDVGKRVRVERSSISRWLHGRSASEALTRGIWDMLRHQNGHANESDDNEEESDEEMQDAEDASGAVKTVPEMDADAPNQDDDADI